MLKRGWFDLLNQGIQHRLNIDSTSITNLDSTVFVDIEAFSFRVNKSISKRGLIDVTDRYRNKILSMLRIDIETRSYRCTFYNVDIQKERRRQNKHNINDITNININGRKYYFELHFWFTKYLFIKNILASYIRTT